MHGDMLGTTTIVTNQANTGMQDLLYSPWGYVLGGMNGSAQKDERYAGMLERDQETQLDPTPNRQYSNGIFRWPSPDPAGTKAVNLADPQTWNMYSYVRNSPTTLTDPSGLAPNGPCVGAGDVCQAMNADPFFQETHNIVPADAALTAYVSGANGTQEKAQTQLSTKSDKVIKQAAKRYGYDAAAFEKAMTTAGAESGIDPNVLVGLGARESSLNPSADNGGLFQIQPARAKDLGISEEDIGKLDVQILKVASALSSDVAKFHGNLDLGIASWTLGVGGTRKLFSSGGMEAVRNALLDRGHPDYGRVGPNYIDVIKSYLGP